MKKPQALTSQSIIRKAIAAPDAQQRSDEEIQTKKIVDLNFKVDISFRREFKHLANMNDLTNIELLRQALGAWKDKHGIK